MTTTKLAAPTMANRPTVQIKKQNAVSNDHIVTMCHDDKKKTNKQKILNVSNLIHKFNVIIFIMLHVGHCVGSEGVI